MRLVRLEDWQREHGFTIWNEARTERRMEGDTAMTTTAELLAAIEYADRTIAQLLDRQPLDKRTERALSRVGAALGGTYFKATGKPLEWWQGEYVDKANGVNGISNT